MPSGSTRDAAFKHKGKSDFIIKIISRHEHTIQGYVEHIYTGQWQSFDSMLELFKLLNKRMDDDNSPQPTNSMRTWEGPEA